MNLKLSKICLSSLLLISSSSVFAGSESGLYIGYGVGSSSLELASGDDSATATKFIGGYNFGIIPLLDLGVEASYNDFGSANIGSESAELTGLNLSALAGLTFGPFAVFAKAGTLDWDFDSTLGNDSGSNTSYGLGVKFQISSIAVLAEYETYDVDAVDDLSMLSVSATYTF